MTLFALAACTLFEPQLQALDPEPRLIEARDVRSLPTGARLPTDLASRPEGGFILLDSLAGQLTTFDAEGSEVQHLAEPGLQATLRAAPAADGEGFWLVVPDGNGLVRVDASGSPVSTLVLSLPAPISVLDLGDELVVGTRYGRLAFLEPHTGAVRLVHDRGADGEPLGVIADIAQLADGTLVAADTLRARIHLATASGQWTSWFGYYGTFIGTLAKPKAVLAGPDDTILVADSGVGGVQLFERDGTPLGAVGQQGAALVVPHAVSLAAGWEPDQVLTLDAVSGEVWTFVLEAAALEAARADAGMRHLRSTLSPPVTEADLCLQCHDGVIRDGRYVWAGGLAHPLDVEAPDAPEALPLTDGKIVCTTCHSPHPSATGDADTFLRMRREDLCVACHALDAHGPEGTAHPVDVEGSCLGCHAVHAADSEPLLRATTSYQACVGCHEDHATPSDHPVGRTVALGKKGLPTFSGEQGCVDCHDLVGGKGKALVRQDLECTTCHEALPGKHRAIRGAHGQPCLGCHDVHDAADQPLLGGTIASRGCAACHQPSGVGHPAASGGCADCHETHAPLPATGCVDCHFGHAGASEQPHGGLACTSCHPAHGAQALGGPKATNPASRRCLACHAVSAGGLAPRIETWEHPSTLAIAALPLVDATGSPVAPGSEGVLVCESCHRVHGEDDLLREAWKDACSSCHGPQALIYYRWYHQPERRSGP